MQAADTKPTTPRAFAWDILVVAAVAFVLHAAVRQFAASDLTSDVHMLDLGADGNVFERIMLGDAPYTDVPLPYGPYCYLYFIAWFKAVGVSVAAFRWAAALAGWARTVAMYGLASRLAGTRWGLVAAGIGLVSPAVLEPLGYAGHLTSALYVILAGATVWAAREPARPARWVWPGLVVGLLLSLRSFSGLLGVAAVGLAGGALGLLHPPVRRGYWLGTAVIPVALLASVAALLRGYGPTMWVLFGGAGAAWAIFASGHSWSVRASTAGGWNAWWRRIGWVAAGMAVAILPWLIPLSLERGLSGALYDVYFRVFADYSQGNFQRVVGFRLAGIGAPPWPGLAAGACLGLTAVGVATGRRLAAVLLAAGTLLVAGLALRGGGYEAVALARGLQLWFVPGALALWAVVRGAAAFRGGRTDPALVALGCVAGVVWLDGAPSAEHTHVNWALAPSFVLLVVLAGRAARGVPASARRTRFAYAAAAVVAVVLFLFPAALLWCRVQPGRWAPVPKRLAWLDLPRAQVYDGADSAAELTASVQYLRARVPPPARVFEFPVSLTLFLSGCRPYANEFHFLPGLASPALDARYGARLREDPPAMVVVRRDPTRSWVLRPSFVAQAFPRITGALDEDYVVVQRIGATYFYVPRAATTAGRPAAAPSGAQAGLPPA